MTASVIIAGGGPVGMGLAIELARRGVASTVIERHLEPQPIPKGQNLTQRTMEHFRAWGVEDAIRNALRFLLSLESAGLLPMGPYCPNGTTTGISVRWLGRSMLAITLVCRSTPLSASCGNARASYP